MVKQKPGHKGLKTDFSKKSHNLSEKGMEAFRRGDYGKAINTWEQLDSDFPGRNQALAEGYFRRSLIATHMLELVLADLEKARLLAPQDGRFAYYLGLFHHRVDSLREAIDAYEQAAQLGFSPRRLALVRALAEVEHNPAVDVRVFEHLSDMERAWLLPVIPLLQNQPLKLIEPQGEHLLMALKKLEQNSPAAAHLWRGLAEFALGRVDQAIVTLAPRTQGQPLPAATESVRAYYHALALALAGRERDACAALEKAVQRHSFPAMVETLAELAAKQAAELFRAGQFDQAQALLTRVRVHAPTNEAVAQQLLMVLSRQAQDIAAAGEWQQALVYWLEMYKIMQLDPELGPAGVVVHNLAIACEKLERWDEAAQYWNEVMGMLPRRQTQKPSRKFSSASRLAQMPVAEARDWLRKRIIWCYQKAGQPEKSVEIYRKAVKQDPTDVSQRMGLVSALLANEQHIAARNELMRIVEIDPKFIAARVNLAHMYAEDMQIELAKEELHKALEIDPASEQARRELGNVLAEEGRRFMNWNMAQARESLAEALKYQPENLELMTMIGQACDLLNRQDEAQQWYGRVLAEGSMEAFGLVFTAHLNLNNSHGAREVLDRFESSSIQNQLEFYIFMGSLCMERFGARLGRAVSQGQTDWIAFGKEIFERALRVQGELSEAERLEMIASALMEKSPAIAMEYVTRLVALEPNNPKYLSMLGVLQAYIGQIDEAKATLKKAEKLAHKQHDQELLDHIREALHMIANPMFRFMGAFGSMNYNSLDEDDDEDDFIDELFDRLR